MPRLLEAIQEHTHAHCHSLLSRWAAPLTNPHPRPISGHNLESPLGCGN